MKNNTTSASVTGEHRPKVSVVIPTYNYGEFIERTIRSILSQSFKDLELIIMDNASTDNTYEIVKSFFHDKRVVYENNGRNIGAMNNGFKGLSKAKGEYFAFLPADDYWLPGSLSLLVNELGNHPDVDYVYGRYVRVDRADKVIDDFNHYGWDDFDHYERPDEIGRLLARDCYISMISLLFRRNLLDQHPLSRDYILGDYEYFLRLSVNKIKSKFINKPLAVHRFHGNQISNNPELFATGKHFEESLFFSETFINEENSAAILGYEDEIVNTLNIKRQLFIDHGGKLTTELNERLIAVNSKLQNLKEIVKPLSNHPLVSVVIVTHNNVSLLRNALLSIRSQSYLNWEIIVINNGGRPIGPLVADVDERICYIELRLVISPSAARNIGIRFAKGEIICYLDDNDTYLTNHVEVVVDELKKSDVDLACTRHKLVPDDGNLDRNIIAVAVNPNNNQTRVMQCVAPISTWAHKKNLFYSFGRFDENNHLLDELDYLYRVIVDYNIKKIPVLTVDSKYETSSIKVNENQAQALHNAFERINEKYSSRMEVLNKKLAQFIQTGQNAHSEQIINKLSVNNVLFVVHDFVPYNHAGTEIYTFNLALELASQGLTVSVFFPVYEPGLDNPYIDKKIEAGLIRYELHVGSFQLMLVRDEQIENAFMEVLNDCCFDAIHFQHVIRLPLSLITLARKFTDKLILTAHDHYLICPRVNMIKADGSLCHEVNEHECLNCLNVNEQTYNTWFDNVQTVLKKIDALISPSRYLAEKLNSQLNSKFIVNSLGIKSIENSNSTVREKIIFLGSIQPLKGVHDLINAYFRSGVNLSLDIWGESALEEYKGQLLELANGNKNISFKGIYNYAMLPDILATARVVVIPSYRESFCLVVREALSAGVPVIAARTGGIPEIVQHGVNGYLFQPGEIDELVDLIRLFETNDQASALNVSQVHIKTVHEEASELLALYNSMTNSGADSQTDLYTKYLQTYTATQINRALNKHIDQKDMPDFQFIVNVKQQESELLANTIESLSNQLIQNWKLSIFADFEAPDGFIEPGGMIDWFMLNDSQKLSGCINALEYHDWLIIVKPGMQLEPHCINLLTEYIVKQPETVFFYSDHDVLTEQGNLVSPCFKPEINEDLLLSYNYLGDFCIVNRSKLKSIDNFNCTYDLALKVFEQFGAEGFYHIAEGLVHLPDKLLDSRELIKDSLTHYFMRQNTDVRILEGWNDSSWHVQYPLHSNPLITIILYAPENLILLQNCLDSIIEKTSYLNYQVYIVSNHKLSVESSAYLEKLKAVESDKLTVYELDCYDNVSLAINQITSMAEGDFLLFLDGGLEIIQPDWLEEMLSLAQRPSVGIVGGRLVSDTYQLMQAGMILGMGQQGIVGSPHQGLSMDEPGYQERAQCVQNLSAVAIDCLLISKNIFQKVNGLDEDKFKVLFNDVDLCLKVRELGYQIVWTPYVTMIQHGISAFKKLQPDKMQAENSQKETDSMLEKWLPQLANDPAYNRNLSLKTIDFQLDTSLNVTWNVDFKDKPRVYAFPANSSGVGEYRVRAPLRGLTQAGLIESSLANNLDQLIFPTPVEIERIKPDVLLIQNGFLDWMLEPWKRYRKFNDVFMVAGQDDLVYSLPQNHPMKGQWPKNLRRKLKEKFHHSDRLIVANEVLAEEFYKLTDEIVIVPNYLETERWCNLKLPEKRQGEKLRVGWAGGREHIADLQFILPVVQALYKDVDWIFMGLCLDELKPYIKEFHQGVLFDQYPQQLANLNLDLAIAPLIHNKFNEAKTNLRLLEYGIMGWPVVCSNIKPYQGAPVTHVANNVQHWITVLKEKISEPETLQHEGEQLKLWVQKNYMLEDHLNQWFKALLP